MFFAPLELKFLSWAHILSLIMPTVGGVNRVIFRCEQENIFGAPKLQGIVFAKALNANLAKVECCILSLNIYQFVMQLR